MTLVLLAKEGEKTKESSIIHIQREVSSGLMMITTLTQEANWGILICSWERGMYKDQPILTVVI